MENLCAAMQQEDSSNYLSAPEFQTMLSSWFEEKGIISDLRSQLRYKMINVLRHTTIGRDLGKRSLPPTSLSKQAVNLIVAEFLMHNKYHYSLSIFNTEASLSNIFPEFPVVFDAKNKESRLDSRFDKENIMNIIELIGITKNSDYCEELLSLYFSYNENILCCLITLLCKLTDKVNQKGSEEYVTKINVDLTNEDNFIKEVGRILVNSSLDHKEVKSTIEKIKGIYEIEYKNLRIEHSKLVNELKVNIASQERKIREINKINKMLESKLFKMNEECHKAKLHMKNLIRHERKLKEELKQSKKHDHLANSKANIITNKENAYVGPTFKAYDICKLPHCRDICKESVSRAEQLTNDNQRLKRENEEQKKEILTLSIKCKDIISEFTDCQSKINLINIKVNEENRIDPLCYQQDFLRAPEVFLERKLDISDVSSESASEEILQQARARLRNLEEESKRIEEKYKNRHLDLHYIPVSSNIL